MSQSINYMEKIPVKDIDMPAADQGITIRITGFSGDSIRTIISYKIDDNPHDYQVSEAFLIDGKNRAYCLVSVERKKKDGEFFSWMEFGPVPPDVKSLELKITTLEQAPAPVSYKTKGRIFIDPWDPRFPLTREQIHKLDCWIDQHCDVDEEEEDDDEWTLRGNWSYEIPIGEWKHEEIDRSAKLDISLTFGEDRLVIQEFRTSNTGAFVLLESRNKALQELGDDFKEKLVEIFDSSHNQKEFEKNLARLGASKSYVPVDLTLRVLDQKKMALYSPDFKDARGVIHNRIYYFFDDHITGSFLDIVIMEIKNLKPDPPLDIKLDLTHPHRPEKVPVEYDSGTIKLKGGITIHDVNLEEEVYRIRYSTDMAGIVERVKVGDASLIMKKEDGRTEEFPSLGFITRYDTDQERLVKLITFPALHREDGSIPPEVTLRLKSLDLKLSRPLVFPFQPMPFSL